MKTSRITLLSTVFALGAGCAPFALAQQPDAKAPLFERLGGLRGITVVVDDFVDRLAKNRTIRANRAVKDSLDRSGAPYLKFQVAQMVCEVTGGPCRYTGRTMKESHAHLGIVEKEWAAMAKDFKASLDRFKVPAAEQRELFDIVGTTKADIVTAR
ncbi:hemoglobin [Crenobacter luteus]|uniref:Globin n=1 Tax=Crenobacter luteus TaxID=1452487 RepID=A0A163DDR5_9NEIS|nr:group 1 truncated hemoglobin [Crenobacter luteus]KZE34481.1 globin [Crenobacter luteus]TCP11349.1 hemoglobin [Crenobacter luteus]